MPIPKSSKSPQDCVIRLCGHRKSKTEELATGREQVKKKTSQGNLNFCCKYLFTHSNYLRMVKHRQILTKQKQFSAI